MMKRFGQFIHTPEKVTTEKTMEDQIKDIRNILRVTALSAHVTTDVLSFFRITQMVNQNTD